MVSGCVPVPPTLLGSGDVRTLTVPVNGHLTLECLADSDPPPDIEWYKGETKLQVQNVNSEKSSTIKSIDLLFDLRILSFLSFCCISWVVVSSSWQGVSTWRYRKSGLRIAASIAVWLPT